MKKGPIVLVGLYALYVIAEVCAACLGVYITARLIEKGW